MPKPRTHHDGKGHHRPDTRISTSTPNSQRGPLVESTEDILRSKTGGNKVIAGLIIAILTVIAIVIVSGMTCL